MLLAGVVLAAAVLFVLAGSNLMPRQWGQQRVRGGECPAGHRVRARADCRSRGNATADPEGQARQGERQGQRQEAPLGPRTRSGAF